MSDGYYSGNEMMSGEVPLESEFQHNLTQYSRPIQKESDWTLTYCPNVGFMGAPTMTSCIGLEEQKTIIPERFQDHFPSQLSIKVLPKEYRRFMEPGITSMYTPPLSPIFQTTPSPVEDTFSDLQIGFSNSMNMRTRVGKEDGIELVQKKFDESTDGSYLYVTTDNVDVLKFIFRERGLGIQDIGRTRTPGVLVVLFKTHEFAKRAFTTQQEIGIKMQPPSFTKRYWFKNPSPKFHVIFETTRRLTVKSGKSSSNAKVGDFLMTDARIGKGCLVLADQMKGHRMRVVGYKGKFICTDGIIKEQKSMSERKFVGWISTQCHKTKEKFILRKSMNEIEDYIFDDRREAFE